MGSRRGMFRQRRSLDLVAIGRAMLDGLFVVGDDPRDRVQPAPMGEGLVVQFGAVGENDGLVRRGNHGLLDRDFDRVDVGDAAVRVDALGAQERPVGVDVLGECCKGCRPDGRPAAAIRRRGCGW